MHTISENKGGYVLIDGQPYKVGDLRIKYTSSTIKVWDKYNAASPVLDGLDISEIENAETSAPFATFDDLKDFVQLNFFSDAPVIGGVSTSAITVSNYAEMLVVALGGGLLDPDLQPSRVAVIFRVADDEIKGMQDTTYIYFPTPAPTLMWVASTNENI